ncbi:hypothetical protein PO909_002866 [Leuciscus waleckii]
MLNRLSLLLSGRELLGKVLDRTAEEASLGYGGVEQTSPLGLPHISQVQPQVSLLDHSCGHHLTQGACGHLRRSESKVGGGTQLIKEPQISPALVHVLEHLGLVDLQDGHGMQRGSCLSRRSVRLRHQGRRKSTGFGWVLRVAPRGSACRTQLHRDRTLHRGNPSVPTSSSLIEGRKGGGGLRTIAGRQWCLPGPRDLLMHIREERYWGWTPTRVSGRTQKTIIQPRTHSLSGGP